MRAKERAWLCAGHKWDWCEDLDFPELFSAAGEPAVLLIPEGYDADRRELAFGWACCELAEQRCGWLFVVRRITMFAQAIGRLLPVAGMLVASRLAF